MMLQHKEAETHDKESFIKKKKKKKWLCNFSKSNQTSLKKANGSLTTTESLNYIF